MRGQANLPAVAIALLVVTTVAILSMTIADAAFQSAERDAIDRASSESVADRLVAADSPITERRNVVNESRLEERHIESIVPLDGAVRFRIDGDVVYERGDPDGPAVRRLTLLAERQVVRVDPPLAFGSVTLPRRSPRATLTIDGSAAVETVRANDRVILHDSGGLDGQYDVQLSRYETTTLRFDGDPQEGDVTVVYYPRRTTKALLEVTVDV